MSPGLLVLGGALVTVALNTAAPGLAFDPADKYFPLPVVTESRATAEQADTIALARWIASNAPADPILVIDSLSGHPLPALPYAVFLAGHAMPVQSLALAETKRVLDPKLSPAAREAVQAAVEEESLWTSDTMARWVGRDYDLILLQEDSTAPIRRP